MMMINNIIYLNHKGKQEQEKNNTQEK